MTEWLVVGLIGGLIGLDATSFPQVMISRPIVAGTITGTVFGRPVEGMIVGFIMEAFSLITLPIGAAKYPESGTATVAAVGAYLAAVPTGPVPGFMVLAVAFALGWEWLAGETVSLQRRSNGQILAAYGAMAATALERRHLAAMSVDLVRGGVLAATGGVIGWSLLRSLGGYWALSESFTVATLMVLTATMVGTTLPLFGGARARAGSWAVGLGVGFLLVVVL